MGRWMGFVLFVNRNVLILYYIYIIYLSKESDPVHFSYLDMKKWKARWQEWWAEGWVARPVEGKRFDTFHQFGSSLWALAGFIWFVGHPSSNRDFAAPFVFSDFFSQRQHEACRCRCRPTISNNHGFLQFCCFYWYRVHIFQTMDGQISETRVAVANTGRWRRYYCYIHAYIYLAHSRSYINNT